MDDRSVQYPQRYQLKKVEGTDDIYDLIPAPGTITAEGTLINKSSLLKDATAALFGLGADAVPDDVLAVLSKAALVGEDGFLVLPNGGEISSVKIETGTYKGNGKYGSENPTALTSKNGTPKIVVVTNDAFKHEAIGILVNSGQKLKMLAILYYSESPGFNESTATVNENVVSWYYVGTAFPQLNESGQTYRYLIVTW